jgi:hypothetical protein
MKKILYLFFLYFTIFCYSQTKPIDFSLSSGVSSPSNSFGESTFASNGIFVDFSVSYYFSKIGAGISIGNFSNDTKSNFNNFTNSFQFPTTLNSTESWNTTYYGVGPEFKMSFNRLEASLITRIGMLSIKPIQLSGGYNIDNVDFSSTVLNFGTKETSNLSYISTGIKFGYKVSNQFKVSLLASYLASPSKEITILQGRKNVTDSNNNGMIDQEDFFDAGGVPIEFEETSKPIKPQFLNYGIGLSYSLGKRTNKIRGTDESYIKANSELENQKELSIKKPVSKGKIVFTNPSKKPKNEKRKIILNNPHNNAILKTENELSNFGWTLVGEQIMNPKFSIEISKLGVNRTQQWSLTSTSATTKLSLEEIFNQNSQSQRISERLRHKDRAVFTEGNYMWRVTELTTGTSSSPGFFTMTSCDINFSVANDTIECLGYEGDNRKYKICFDATYQSNTGDLTYTNPGSGLTVYDQNNSGLSYTLVSPNLSLLTQIGTTSTTVSYCFEVVVSSSVNAIGFGLQGDDLDPSPILCQPGVSANFDELPNCLCDDCDEKELTFENFNISLNGNTGNQFNFNGNINVNVPIYGIEFQVQSYNYTANPSGCTKGVSSVEESGMILLPATTINGSSTLQLSNETVSGSSNTNNNATKNIKYTSNTPLTGSIPVNLTIGLPGPISGLDPSCCVIDYTVCIKVKIYYDKDSCKSCVFTHCFNFNNQ